MVKLLLIWRIFRGSWGWYIGVYTERAGDCIMVYIGLEIGGIASPKANHFWNIANHFGKVIRQIILALRITLGRLQIIFQMDSPEDIFFVPTPFLHKMSPF